MSNIKFSQLPNLATPLANTIVPVVSGGTNYTSTMANITTYVNTNSGAISASSLSASGNVQGAYVKGNGSELTSITGANVTGTVSSATSATTAGTVTTNAQPNITSVGTLTSLAVTGNITSGNISTGIVSATGNISSDTYFVGNGRFLTGVGSSYNIFNTAVEIGATAPNATQGLGITSTGTNNSGIVISLPSSTGSTPAGIKITNGVSANANAISISGPSSGTYANSTPILSVNNVLSAASGSRTLDGYLAIYVNGALRYIPYYQ